MHKTNYNLRTYHTYETGSETKKKTKLPVGVQ